MRLYGIDELPYHQQPTPFHMPATSDSHFNDGYFFAFYTSDWYFFAGLRLHPNANVIDGWVSVAHDDRQLVTRASRALRPGYDDLRVGPLRLEVLEPMQRVRLVAEDNPAEITFDVELVSQASPFVEDRYQHVRYGAVINDTLRYTTVCRANGRARARGTDLEVDSWHSIRDHSWGVRSSMSVPTRVSGTDRTGEETFERALRLWVPFECGDHTGFINTHEDIDGRPLDFEGRLDFRDGRSVALTGARHSLRYHPGTERPVGGTLTVDGADGVERTYTLRASGTPADVQGGGYYRGWSDGYGPGVYRGADVIETDDYSCDPDGERSGPPHVPVKHRLGPTEFPMHLEAADGSTGMAHFEHSIRGAYRPYGFA
jgi:hypothetical protein